jgi:hypothetical protein
MLHHSANLGDTVIYGIGDTYELVEFTRGALECINQGQWVGCRRAGRFALFQHLPAAFWIKMGSTTGQVMRSLGELNLLSFWVLIVTTTAFFGRRRILEALLFALLIVTSPLLVYARSSFGEMTAAALTSLYVMSVITRQKWWITVGLGLLVGATKDIAAPFVAMLGFAALGPDLIRHPGGLRAHISPIVAASAVALVPGAVFNYFRFGTLVNLEYISILPTINLNTAASYLLGLWFAPNFGLLFFWPAYCAVLCILATTLVSQYSHRSSARLADVSRWLPLLGSMGVLLGLSVGLTRTGFAIAGFSWPPRYLLPWSAAVLTVLLHHYGDELRFILKRTGNRLVFIGAIVLTFAGGLPNLAVNFRPHRLSAVSNVPFEPGCPHQPVPWNARTPEDQEYFLACEYFRMWQPQRFTQIEAVKVIAGFTADRSYIVSAVAYGALVTALCLEIRRRAIA